MITGLVSVIVLNWNNKDVISDCLDSLLRQAHKNHEIILVDNGSRDGSLEMIKEKYGSSVIIIKNPKNLGFAEGVNIGIKASRGEFVALLNSDATAKENWLEEMIKAISRSESFGMCACKIYLAGRDHVIDNTGALISRDGLGRSRGRLEQDQGQYDHMTEALSPSGCAALYRRKMLDEVGLFDKHFFAYAEDIDLGLSGRLLGYKCAFVSSAIVYHRFSVSTHPVSYLKAYYVERNRLWVTIKHFPLSWLFLSLFHTLVRYGYHFYGLLRRKGAAARYIEQRNALGLVWIVIIAYLSTLWFLPYLIAERMRIRKKIRIPISEFKSLLQSYCVSAREAALGELW